MPKFEEVVFENVLYDASRFGVLIEHSNDNIADKEAEVEERTAKVE